MRPALGITIGATAMVLCCAAPILIVAGGFGLLGALSANPYLTGGALLALAATAGLLWTRTRRRRSSDECCAPWSTPPRDDPCRR